ncbi:MAG: hypothetical protein M0017_01665 [Desulfobacteraceae bacterium]|nr:hypothetical protein [Desulfobacteraceae bacterium]
MMTAPMTIPSAKGLTEKAMLVMVSISQWTASKLDPQVTEKVNEDHFARRDAGRWRKLLVPKEALAAVAAIASETRCFHYAQTLPWHDAGPRILPAKNYLHYSQELQQKKGAFEHAVAEFLDQYDLYRSQAPVRLGTMYNPKDYPTVEQLGRKFALEVSVSPLPAAQDFRVALADEEIRTIQAGLEARLVTAQAAAMKDLWQRLYDAVFRMMERLTALDTQETRRLYTSVVTNLQDLVDLLPRLNLNDDPALENMRREVEARLCRYTRDDLKDNPRIRKWVKEDARAILDAMSGFIGGGHAQHQG